MAEEIADAIFKQFDYAHHQENRETLTKGERKILKYFNDNFIITRVEKSNHEYGIHCKAWYDNSMRAELAKSCYRIIDKGEILKDIAETKDQLPILHTNDEIFEQLRTNRMKADAMSKGRKPNDEDEEKDDDQIKEPQCAIIYASLKCTKKENGERKIAYRFITPLGNTEGSALARLVSAGFKPAAQFRFALSCGGHSRWWGGRPLSGVGADIPVGRGGGWRSGAHWQRGLGGRV